MGLEGSPTVDGAIGLETGPTVDGGVGFGSGLISPFFAGAIWKVGLSLAGCISGSIPTVYHMLYRQTPRGSARLPWCPPWRGEP